MNKAVGQLVLITSIAPKRVEAQQLAIDSWTKLGAKVVSVNYTGEKGFLEQNFTGVTFHYIRQTIGNRLRHWNYVPIRELLTLAMGSWPNTPVGLINSDIVLAADPFEVFARRSDLDLLIANREDVDDQEQTTGDRYRFGFDLFVFRDSRLLNSFAKNDYYLGVPWWDYWVPLQAVREGLKIGLWSSVNVRHVRHTERYNTRLYDQYGAIFLRGIRRWRHTALLGEHAKFGLNGLATASANLICASAEEV